MRAWSFWAIGLLGLGFGLAAACGDDGTGPGSSSSASSSTSTGSTGGGGQISSSSTGNEGGCMLCGGGPPDDGGEGGGCVGVVSKPDVNPVPIDIIFVINNSGSMTPYILAVQKNINENFAQIIEASGVQYRVIMIAAHGKATVDQSICIEAPLSSIPPGNCAPDSPNFPGQPGLNPPTFFHYNVEIGSHDALCQLLATYDKADKHYYSEGWRDWLNKDSFKIFLVISDDGIDCKAGGFTAKDADQIAAGEFSAKAFDQVLLTKDWKAPQPGDPKPFGTDKHRNYMWHSIIGLVANPINPGGVWLHTDPVTDVTCSPDPNDDCSAKIPPPDCMAGPGTSFQWLSVNTDGLRFPLCDLAHFDLVFKAIAKGVIAGSLIACEYPFSSLPPPPTGFVIDKASLKVLYTPGGQDKPIAYQQVASEKECGPEKFWVDDMGTEKNTTDDVIRLCEEACDEVQADLQGNVAVSYDCKATPP
ncbi:MAG: VWA domain-containing protein [Deltaproteobacteria bacterium]|nr:VWA domain-containing protein [Deltaproteobacteria bacterium]